MPKPKGNSKRFKDMVEAYEAIGHFGRLIASYADMGIRKSHAHSLNDPSQTELLIQAWELMDQAWNLLQAVWTQMPPLEGKEVKWN